MRNRRLAPRSIQKVNAQSIGGYFGEGTSCFFIRGTILSDSPIGGEYPTLNFMRDGNTIEIGWFDGSWAAVTIQTRYGNRPGDDVTAKMYLRDEDLKALGVDCTRIVALKGLPFTFDVEALAAGLFEEAAIVAELVPESPADNVVYLREPELAPGAIYEPEPEPEPEPEFIEPEPIVTFVQQPEPEPEPVAIVAVAEEPVALEAIVIEPVVLASAAAPDIEVETVVAAYTRAEPSRPAPSAFDIATFFDLFKSGKLPFGKNPVLDIGASVAAVAVPMIAYLFVEFMKNKSAMPRDDGDKPA